jgi:EpsD family peptidyl-prolyl cis-trans isomerase
VNQALERVAALKPDQVEAASRKAVAALVEQEIVVQKARDLKLDREQRVVQKIEAAKRDIIARAYLDRIADGTTKPSAGDVRDYYEKNPALFKDRRIYSFQELTVDASAEQRSGIEAQLKSLKSSSDLEAYLKARQIPARIQSSTVAAENVPLALLERVASLKAGQGLIVPVPSGLRVVLLAAVQDSPIVEEQARPAIEAFLLSQRKRQTVEKELVALRSATQVEYLGKYADMAASAPTTVRAAGAGKSASSPQ